MPLSKETKQKPWTEKKKQQRLGYSHTNNLDVESCYIFVFVSLYHAEKGGEYLYEEKGRKIYNTFVFWPSPSNTWYSVSLCFPTLLLPQKMFKYIKYSKNKRHKYIPHFKFWPKFTDFFGLTMCKKALNEMEIK